MTATLSTGFPHENARHRQVRFGDIAVGRALATVVVAEEFEVGAPDRPAKMCYEFGALATGKLTYAKVLIVLDGDADASVTPEATSDAVLLAVGPYEIPHVEIDAYGAYSSLQACFAHESMMDKLAAALDMDQLRVRQLNVVSQGAKLAEMLTALNAMPLPEPLDASDIRNLPGGVSQTTHGEGVVRGVGFGVGIENIRAAEAFDAPSTARVRLEVIDGEPVALVHTAASEVGQLLITVEAQIARTELGIELVVIHPSDNRIGDSGAAVQAACRAVRQRVLAMAQGRHGAHRGLRLRGGNVVAATGEVLDTIVEVLGGEVVEETRTYHHRSNSHTQLEVSAHRAVVDVDVELGLVKVVALQALGPAVMEEIQGTHGTVRNRSFADRSIPAILETTPQRLEISTPAVAAAIRDACRRRGGTGNITRVPVRPEDIIRSS